MGSMRGEGGAGGGGGVPTLTASRAVVTNGSGALAASDVTAAELAHLDGVTSAIQTQIDAKAATSSLATVATSGAYNDLTGKPTLGTAAALDAGSASGVATLGGDGKVPTAQLPAAVLGAASYQGTWNATTNSPAIPAAASGNKGYYYKVATAGTTTIDGISEWAVGDWIISNGATWDKVDNTEQVSSVAGRTGAVVLTKTDVGLSNVPNTDCTNASNLASGTVPTARLGSGTADNTTFLRGDQTWATPAGGGGGDSTFLEGVAIISATGNDTTGTVGTSSAVPLPYATPQAAVDDGATSLVLLPKAGSYGGITISGAGTALALNIAAWGRSGGPQQIGAIVTNGGALTIQCTTGRHSLFIDSITTTPTTTTGAVGGAVTLRHLRAGLITTQGSAGGEAENGGNAGTLDAIGCILLAGGNLYGGAGGNPSAAAGSPGTTGGNAVAAKFVDCQLGGTWGVSGGASQAGRDGDLTTTSGGGGNGGVGGSVVASNCADLFNEASFDCSGAAGSTAGADGGMGQGSDGGGGSAGVVSGAYSRFSTLTLNGGSAASTFGGGGSVYLDHCFVSSVVSIYDGNAVNSGTAQLNYTTITGGVTGAATKTGHFVVDGATAYTDYA